MRVSALALRSTFRRSRYSRRERVTSLSLVPSKTRVKRDRKRPPIPTVKSKKRHTPCGGTGVCTCLSRMRVAVSALDARGASGPRVRARLSLDHPAHNVCVRSVSLTLADRGSRVCAAALDRRFLGPLAAQNQLPGSARQFKRRRFRDRERTISRSPFKQTHTCDACTNV